MCRTSQRRNTATRVVELRRLTDKDPVRLGGWLEDLKEQQPCGRERDPVRMEEEDEGGMVSTVEGVEDRWMVGVKTAG
jgi:hypothetical protein